MKRKHRRLLLVLLSLGLVGAGGIGYYIVLYVRGFQYERVAVLLVVVIAVVFALDYLTLAVRRWVR